MRPMRSLSRGEDLSEQLYPDLIAAGSLARALRQSLPSGGGTGLDVRDHIGRWSAVVTGGTAERGDFRVYIGADERAFGVAGWSRGVMLIGGSTAELADVGGAAQSWHAGARLEELHRQFPFLEVTSLALAHQRGPADAVAEQWRGLREGWGRDDRFRFVVDLIDAAHAAPQLRQLYVYTSHTSLHFSTCTGFPYSQDVPYIDPRTEGGYVVRNAADREPVGAADDAERAVALLVGQLPPDLGPAAAGTADPSAC
ncbi:DUF6193 family natural product biosynthesis protein [Dactylosporangium sp. NPDC049742]|uniref:DUF6193 family natural product biosynthesis protein n=1 Tax=Dactylosporangium sp. NPDC049742 TaxID=3154737 RepID=UPI0034393232